IAAASSPTVTRGLNDQESSSRPGVGAGTCDPAGGPARAAPAPVTVRPASARTPATTTRRPSLRNRTTPSAYPGGLRPAGGAEAGQAGHDHGRAQAEGEGDGGPGDDRAEAGRELGAGQRRQVGQGPGHGQERAAEP